MEGEDPKRSDRPNKGKPPAYLVDYEVPPYVRPQDPTPVGHHLPPSSGVRLRNGGNEDIHQPQPPPLLAQFQQTLANHPSQPPSAVYLSQPPRAAYLSQPPSAHLSQHSTAPHLSH